MSEKPPIRYKLIVAYDGTRYKGFQRQSSTFTSATNNTTFAPTASVTTNNEKNTPAHESEKPRRGLKRRHPNNHNKKKIKARSTVPLTVQETLEDALEFYSGLDRYRLKVRFAGRTDRGVSAKGQVVVVSLPASLEKGVINGCSGSNDRGEAEEDTLWHIRKSINSRLPNDISIEDVSVCSSESFDPRSNAKRKQYSYLLRYREKVRIGRDDQEDLLPICLKGGPQLLRNALDTNRIWICPWSLDDSKLKRYCEMLTGTHDYSAFVHPEARKTRDNRMTVNRLDYERIKIKEGKAPVWDVRFLVEAKGFGRSQVRNMIGFLVDVCRGHVKDETAESMWKEDRDQLAKQINAAPACGLCLENVVY